MALQVVPVRRPSRDVLPGVHSTHSLCQVPLSTPPLTTPTTPHDPRASMLHLCHSSMALNGSRLFWWSTLQHQALPPVQQRTPLRPSPQLQRQALYGNARRPTAARLLRLTPCFVGVGCASVWRTPGRAQQRTVAPGRRSACKFERGVRRLRWLWISPQCSMGSQGGGACLRVPRWYSTVLCSCQRRGPRHASGAPVPVFAVILYAQAAARTGTLYRTNGASPRVAAERTAELSCAAVSTPLH